MATPLTARQLADICTQDDNGDNTYSNDKALYGYIEASKYLHVPIVTSLDTALRSPPDLDIAKLGKADAINDFLTVGAAAHRTAHPYVLATNLRSTPLDVIKIAVANYESLLNGGVAEKAAFLAATLRARWIYLGCLYPDRATKHVVIDEVIRNPMNAGAALAVAGCANLTEVDALSDPVVVGYLNLARDPLLGLAWVVNWAETIWSISEYLFRTRGHHFKNDYKELITRMFRAATEGTAELANDFPFDHVFHTAIHPFGIKALAVMAYHFCAWGKIGNAMIVRTSGAPNGFAVATTASACLKAISGEMWYPSFYANHKKEIEAIDFYSAAILDNKYSFHLAAGLYGAVPIRSILYNGVTKTMSTIDQEVSAMAPILQAFINFCKGLASTNASVTYSFSNAKVLEKRAATNPILTAKIEALLETSVTLVANSNDMKSAVDAAFPNFAAAYAGKVP